MKTYEEYLKIMELPNDFSLDDLNKKYKELSKKYHPDKHQGNALQSLAEEKQKEINEAYSFLKKLFDDKQNEKKNFKVLTQEEEFIFIKKNIDDASSRIIKSIQKPLNEFKDFLKEFIFNIQNNYFDDNTYEGNFEREFSIFYKKIINNLKVDIALNIENINIMSLNNITIFKKDDSSFLTNNLDKVKLGISILKNYYPETINIYNVMGNLNANEAEILLALYRCYFFIHLNEGFFENLNNIIDDIKENLNVAISQEKGIEYNILTDIYNTINNKFLFEKTKKYLLNKLHDIEIHLETYLPYLIMFLELTTFLNYDDNGIRELEKKANFYLKEKERQENIKKYPDARLEAIEINEENLKKFLEDFPNEKNNFLIQIYLEFKKRNFEKAKEIFLKKNNIEHNILLNIIIKKLFKLEDSKNLSEILSLLFEKEVRQSFQGKLREYKLKLEENKTSFLESANLYSNNLNKFIKLYNLFNIEETDLNKFIDDSKILIQEIEKEKIRIENEEKKKRKEIENKRKENEYMKKALHFFSKIKQEKKENEYFKYYRLSLHNNIDNKNIEEYISNINNNNNILSLISFLKEKEPSYSNKEVMELKQIIKLYLKNFEHQIKENLNKYGYELSHAEDFLKEINEKIKNNYWEKFKILDFTEIFVFIFLIFIWIKSDFFTGFFTSFSIGGLLILIRKNIKKEKKNINSYTKTFKKIIASLNDTTKILNELLEIISYGGRNV